MVSISGAARYSAPQSFHKVHQTNSRALFSGIMGAAPTLVGPPVHAFGLVGKVAQHARTSTQLHSDFLGLPKPPLMGRFLLASVGEPTAFSASKPPASPIQFDYATIATNSRSITRTHKPDSFTSEAAGRPKDRNTLLDVRRLAVREAGKVQFDQVAFGLDVDSCYAAVVAVSLTRLRSTAAAANNHADASLEHLWIDDSPRLSSHHLHDAPFERSFWAEKLTKTLGNFDFTGERQILLFALSYLPWSIELPLTGSIFSDTRTRRRCCEDDHTVIAQCGLDLF